MIHVLLSKQHICIERSLQGNVNQPSPQWLKTKMKLKKLSLSSQNWAQVFKLIPVIKESSGKHAELVCSNLQKIQADVLTWIFSRQKINNTFLGGHPREDIVQADTDSLLEEAIYRTWPPVNPQASPGHSELLSGSPVLGMHNLLTIPTAGTIFKDVALIKQCVVEAIWMV